MITGIGPLRRPARRSRSRRSTASSASRFDAALVATGSRPRIPEWCHPDGDRILTTRDCYPPKEFPRSVTVIGSGVTGVEFVHMFSSFGAEVTLVVSPPAGAAGEGPRGGGGARGRLPATAASSCSRARGPTASSATGRPADVVVRCDDGRVVRSTHAVLAIGSIPNSDGLGLDARRRRARRGRLRADRPPLRHQRRPHLRRRRRQRQAAAVVGGVDAGPQDRRARDGPAHPRAPPPRLRQGGVGHLHRARDRRRRPGRGRGVRRRAARSASPRCRSRPRRRR